MPSLALQRLLTSAPPISQRRQPIAALSFGSPATGSHTLGRSAADIRQEIASKEKYYLQVGVFSKLEGAKVTQDKFAKLVDKNKYQDVQILSYAVKYASNFYGPFRDAVGSKKLLKSDKKNYQMDFHNSDESLREVLLDISEGADMVMIKPGLAYLDIISKVKEKYNIPVIAYNVSGEYSMIKHAIQNKIMGDDAIYETMVSFKRAGASAIVTYFANEIVEKFIDI